MSMERQILDVSQVNEYIKNLMDGDELLAGLCIRGELSNQKKAMISYLSQRSFAQSEGLGK